MDTLALDRTTWDLFLDANGNIAVASNPYSLAQDLASAIRLFSGELYYDTTQGVPYFAQILGHMPPIEFMKAQFVGAALTTPEVTAARCFISGIIDRTLTGQVQIFSAAGVAVATF